MLNCAETAAVLRNWDNILVLSHASPDGDTLGSACALMRGLLALGKRARFACADTIAPKYGYLFDGRGLCTGACDDCGRSGSVAAGGPSGTV